MTKLLLEKFSTNNNLVFNEIVSFYALNPEECVVFLEGLFLIKFKIDLDKSDIELRLDPEDKELLKCAGDMFLQHSLTLWNLGNNAECEEKILKFINIPGIIFDSENALFLFHTQQFTSGVLIINEKLQQHSSSLEIYAQRNDFESIWNLCEKYGTNDLSLWASAINYCAQVRNYF